MQIILRVLILLLVRQGQISNLINENPKSRKRILEEAAGISGLYHRRHESELKLNASENNLERIYDILSKLEEQQSIKKQASKQKITVYWVKKLENKNHTFICSLGK